MHLFNRRVTRVRLAIMTAAVSAFTASTLHAQIVKYQVTGNFTGTSSGDATLRSAISPLLGTSSFTMLFSLNTAAAGAPALGGGTLYRAVSNTASTFAAFTSTEAGCTSNSDFICTTVVQNGTGTPGTGADNFQVFGDIGRSTAFNGAAGGARPLDFQFQFFLFDFTGNTLANESLNFDLRSASPSSFTGSFSVFAPGTQGFDRADFGLRLTSISLQQTVPEPSTYALMVGGLGALALLRRRRPRRSSGGSLGDD